MAPHIGIIYVNIVSGDEFEEFKQIVSAQGADVQLIEREPPGPMAGIEWLLPTFVIGFVASSYFGGFLQEMGKDHYLLVKQQFKKLYSKVAGPDAPDIKLVGSAGKVKPVQPYSLYFSLVGDGPDGLSIKLLLRKPISQIEFEKSIDGFLDYLHDISNGSLDERSSKRIEAVKPAGKTVLVVFDEVLEEIVPVDPRSGELIR